MMFTTQIVIVTNNSDLDAQLGAAPVSPLGVVPNGAARPQPDPVRDGLVLLQLDGECPLGAEGLLGRLAGREEATEGGTG